MNERETGRRPFIDCILFTTDVSWVCRKSDFRINQATAGRDDYFLEFIGHFGFFNLNNLYLHRGLLLSPNHDFMDKHVIFAIFCSVVSFGSLICVHLISLDNRRFIESERKKALLRKGP